MKKLLSVLTIITLLLSCLSFSAGSVFAAENDYTYKALDSATAEITGYKGSASNITIPSKIGGLTVVSIGKQAFYQNKTIKNVTIPNTVKSIGDKAFYASYMSSVTIPDSVETMGQSAFSYCIYLTDLTRDHQQ